MSCRQLFETLQVVREPVDELVPEPDCVVLGYCRNECYLLHNLYLYGYDALDVRVCVVVLNAPPHGGCAFGLDRLVQIMLDEPNLREVVIFPTNQRGQDLMMGAPATVTEKQLRETHIQIRKKN